MTPVTHGKKNECCGYRRERDKVLAASLPANDPAGVLARSLGERGIGRGQNRFDGSDELDPCAGEHHHSNQ